MPEDELFAVAMVRVRVPPEDLPGYKAPRVVLRGVRRGHQLQAQVERPGPGRFARGLRGERYYEIV